MDAGASLVIARSAQDEAQNDEDDEEATSEGPDARQVALDVSVVRVELGHARRGHKGCGLADLASGFPGHVELLLFLDIGRNIDRSVL